MREHPRRFLLATHNRDKALLASELLRRANSSLESVYLDEIGILDEIVEAGTLLERATRKAISYGSIAQFRKASFDFVMGIDDAIVFAGQDFDPVDSARGTDAILSGSVSIGDPVVVRHAFTLCAPAKAISSLVVDIPFEYVGPSDVVGKMPKTYPLKEVLALPGSREPLAQLPVDAYVEHYWHLCSVRFLHALAVCGAL